MPLNRGQIRVLSHKEGLAGTPPPNVDAVNAAENAAAAALERERRRRQLEHAHLHARMSAFYPDCIVHMATPDLARPPHAANAVSTARTANAYR